MELGMRSVLHIPVGIPLQPLQQTSNWMDGWMDGQCVCQAYYVPMYVCMRMDLVAVREGNNKHLLLPSPAHSFIHSQRLDSKHVRTVLALVGGGVVVVVCFSS